MVVEAVSQSPAIGREVVIARETLELKQQGNCAVLPTGL
jgi:hypothetical protein